MSVRLRLQRHGVKKKPFYSIVASDKRAARDGRFIEKLGFYDPNQQPSTFQIKVDRLQYWYSVGADLSEQLKKIVKIQKIELSRGKTHKAR
jgi:small subunit ribosomal protein S16